MEIRLMYIKLMKRAKRKYTLQWSLTTVLKKIKNHLKGY